METQILEALADGQKSVRELADLLRVRPLGLYNTINKLVVDGAVVQAAVSEDGSYYYRLAPEESNGI